MLFSSTLDILWLVTSFSDYFMILEDTYIINAIFKKGSIKHLFFSLCGDLDQLSPAIGLNIVSTID